MLNDLVNFHGSDFRRPLLGVVVLALASCSSPVIPESGDTYVGEIVAAGVGLVGNDGFRIHVKADPDEECGIRFALLDRTQIFDSRTRSSRVASTEILEVGARVRVGHNGRFTSCPAHAGAETIERLR